MRKIPIVGRPPPQICAGGSVSSPRGAIARAERTAASRRQRCPEENQTGTAVAPEQAPDGRHLGVRNLMLAPPMLPDLIQKQAIGRPG